MVYVVTVSEALAFKPEVFRFPVVGSFSYLGWFDREDALEFARGYEEKGMDTDVRGASAYSTLGWFRDPLLSSMIPKVDGKISLAAYPDLVNVFLHESVHATLYVRDQSWFNESLASFVADILTERFFAEQGLREGEAYQAYLARRKGAEAVQERLARAYKELGEIYGSAASAGEKLVKKNSYLRALEAELGFKRKITNATLIQFKTYHPGDHGFRRLFDRSGGDLGAFLRFLSRLKPEDFPAPQMEDFERVLSVQNLDS